MASPFAAQGNSSRLSRSTSKLTSDPCRRRRFHGGVLRGVARVERVAKRVAEQIETQHGGTDCQTGRKRGPRGVAKLVEIAAVGDHRPPTWRRRLDTEP